MVVKRVDAHPKLKTRFGEWYYTYAAVTGFNRHYLMGTPARLRLRSEQGEVEGITTVAQNSDPFTYFGEREVRVCEDVAFDNGTLSVAMLKRAALRDIPTLMARCLSTSDRFRAVDHRQIEHFAGLHEARVDSLTTDAAGKTIPFPVEVDGDYIGDHESLELGIDPAALTSLPEATASSAGSSPARSPRTSCSTTRSASRSSTCARSFTATPCSCRASTTRRSPTCRPS